MNKLTYLFPLLAFPLTMLTLTAAPLVDDDDEREGEEIELDEAEVFIEWNSTDGDYGIQFFWDGSDWDRMKCENTPGQTVLQVRARKNLQAQGLTEGFFESVEPDPEELSLEEFLERFPEGEYEYEGRTLDGAELEGETDFTHVIPSPPAGLWPAEGDVVDVSAPLVVSFDAVTQDTLGNDIEPVLYEVVMEFDDEENDLTHVFSMTLPGDTANPAVTMPPEFMHPGLEYKFEVIVQEESHNRTITESTFTTL